MPERQGFGSRGRRHDPLVLVDVVEVFFATVVSMLRSGCVESDPFMNECSSVPR